MRFKILIFLFLILKILLKLLIFLDDIDKSQELINPFKILWKDMIQEKKKIT